MRFDVKHNCGHYELYVDGEFYGSYDTVAEAARDIEKINQDEKVTA